MKREENAASVSTDCDAAENTAHHGTIDYMITVLLAESAFQKCIQRQIGKYLCQCPATDLMQCQSRIVLHGVIKELDDLFRIDDDNTKLGRFQ